jgi:Cu-Zn family superoxide dismutase
MARCCALITGDGIAGSLVFHQAQEDAPTTIEGTIRGLSPGRHGLHIHVFGDFTDGFISAGGIFNPFGRNHGSPDDEERMSGDLGMYALILYIMYTLMLLELKCNFE